jgi:membrane-associated phospholipid phosphatase
VPAGYVLAIVRMNGVLTLVRGWAPFAVLLIAYELMRDLAALVGAAPHNLAPLDRSLFAGYEPTLVLQSLVNRLADPDVFEDAASLVYAFHWLLPIAVGAWLWMHDRRGFYRFGSALVILCALAFTTYVLAPTSPPWLAQPTSVQHVIENALQHSGLPSGVVWLYAHHDYNLYAAFPSLHAGFPVVAAMSTWQRNRTVSLVLFAWTAVVWIAVVYLGEHYVTDVLGGLIYALVAVAMAGYVIARWPRLAPTPA